MFEAVLFDLDGTLIDSRADIAAAANRALRSAGHDVLSAPTVEGFIGHGATHLVTRCLETVGAPVEPECIARFQELFLRCYGDHLADQTRPYPGVPSGLAALRSEGVATGIVTNKPEAPARAILEALDLGPFDAVVGGDTLASRKPDPAPLRFGLSLLGVEPSQALFVGDSLIDLETARGAGTAFRGVGYGIGSASELRQQASEPVATTFTEVIEAVLESLSSSGRQGVPS